MAVFAAALCVSRRLCRGYCVRARWAYVGTGSTEVLSDSGQQHVDMWATVSGRNRRTTDAVVIFLAGLRGRRYANSRRSAGKKRAMAEAARPITKTLRPVKEDSRDWDTTENLYIEGDNLEVLKLFAGELSRQRSR